MLQDARAGKPFKGLYSKRRRREWVFCYSFLFYPLLLFVVFYVYVNANSFVLAFQNISLEGTRTFAGLDNFRQFMSGVIAADNIIRISFFNSIRVYLINLLVCMPLYIIFAWLLFKRFFADKAVRIVIMLPSIISAFVFCLVFRNFAGAPMQQLMQQWGFERFPNLVDDSRFSFGTTLFYMIWVSFSTSLIVYPNAMRAIDPALLESAQIDGVKTMWQELRFIVLPLIFPTISTFLVLGFSSIMSNCGPLVAFYMYSAPSQAYNMGYYMLVETLAKASNPIGYPEIAAGGMILTAAVAPLTLLLRAFLEKKSPMEN